MGFVKKTWKDRLVEYAGRRQLKRVSGDPNGTIVVDVTRNEGTVSQTGDAFSAANMNDLEQRIGDGFDEVINNLTQKLPNDIKLITEGSGKDVKYYAQLGADTASKKLLGSGAELLWTNPSVSSQATIVIPCDWQKYDKIVILACEYYGRPGNKYIQCCDIKATTKYWNLSVSGFVVYRTVEFNDENITMSAETVHNSQSYNIPLKIWGLNTEVDMFTYP